MTENTPRDSNPSANECNTAQAPSARHRGLWFWFASGFLIVFVGMSLAVTMYSMHPSGEFVVACKLWRYYLIEIQRAVNSSGNLGPGTGASSAAISTAFQHVLLSAVGGAATWGVGWTVRKARAKQ